jgi:hypothetical protein
MNKSVRTARACLDVRDGHIYSHWSYLGVDPRKARLLANDASFSNAHVQG